jgi:WD40 repeat protein
MTTDRSSVSVPPASIKRRTVLAAGVMGPAILTGCATTSNLAAGYVELSQLSPANGNRNTAVFALAWSPDDRFIALSSQAAPDIELWEAATGRKVAAISRVQSTQNSLAFGGGSGRLFTPWTRQADPRSPLVISVLDGSTLAVRAELPRPGMERLGQLKQVAASADGMTVAGFFAADPIFLFDVTAGSSRLVQDRWRGPISGMDLSRSGATVAVAGSLGEANDGRFSPTVAVVNCATAAQVWVRRLPGNPQGAGRGTCWSRDERSLAVVQDVPDRPASDLTTTDGAIVVDPRSTGALHNRVHVLDAGTGASRVTFRWGGGTVRQPAWSPDGRFILAPCSSQGLRVLDLEKRTVARLSVAETSIACAFSNAGDRIAMSDGPMIRVLRWRGG